MTESIRKLSENVGYTIEIPYLRCVKEEKTYQELEAEVADLQKKLLRQAELVAYLSRMLYGRKSDMLKKHPHQDPDPGLFDNYFQEALDEKDALIEKISIEANHEAAERRSRRKKEPSRPGKYQYFGLEERWHTEYPEGINLEDYDEIGADECRILHHTAAVLWVECIKLPQLRSKNERDSLSSTILQAPRPRAVIGGNHVAADLLAQIAVNKFTYSIPEYRQVQMYSEKGVKLPTSTVNDWIHAVANKLYPLYESQSEKVLHSDYLQVDEVPWKIADRPGMGLRNGYAWQFRDQSPGSCGTYFYYFDGSREGEVARSQLLHYKGNIQTDGYRVYDYFEKQKDVTLLGCMAHVRRKFVDAQKNSPALAAEAVARIGLLYTIEGNLRARGATFEEICRERQEKSIPIMDALEIWMKAASTKYTPDSSFGKALEYAYKMWPRLKRYAEDGRYQIDNNPVERGQRTTVMGRKNYLFSKNNHGAQDKPVFYTLLESCKIVGISPLEWLTYVLDRLHPESTEDEIQNLLPCNYKKNQG